MKDVISMTKSRQYLKLTKIVRESVHFCFLASLPQVTWNGGASIPQHYTQCK
jgi:hypothetical protein